MLQKYLNSLLVGFCLVPSAVYAMDANELRRRCVEQDQQLTALFNERDRGGSLHCPRSELHARNLLDRGADVNARDAAGRTPLMVVPTSIAKVILEFTGIKQRIVQEQQGDSCSRLGRTITPVEINMLIQAYLIYQAQLERVALLDALDSSGQTALSIARAQNNREKVKLLEEWNHSAKN